MASPAQKRLKTLSLPASTSAAAKELQHALNVSVVTLAGNTIGDWQLERDVTVARLKAKVFDAAGMQPSRQKLVFGCRVLEDGNQLRELAGPDVQQLHICLIRQRMMVVSGSTDRTARLWDVEEGKCLEEFPDHRDHVSILAVDWSAERLLTVSFEGELCLWDMCRGGKIMQATEGVGRVSSRDSVAVHWPSNRILLGTMQGNLELWNVNSCKFVTRLGGHRSCVDFVTADWGSARALSGSRDRTLRLWDMEGKRCIRVLKGHAGSVVCCTADWASGSVLSGGMDCTLRLWRLLRGEPVQVLKGHTSSVQCVAADTIMERMYDV